jgi:hypothetical protein
MLAEGLAVFIEKLRVRSFQRPGGRGAVGLASVNLIAFGVDAQEELLIRGRLKCSGNILGRGGKRKNGDRCCGESDGHESVRAVGHGIFLLPEILA